MNNIKDTPLVWVHPPQLIDKEESFLDEVFGNKENVPTKRGHRSAPKRRIAVDSRPGSKSSNKEVKRLGATLKDMKVGSDYCIDSKQPFTRLQRRRMTVESIQTDQDRMPPPLSPVPRKKRRASTQGGNSRPKSAAPATKSSPNAAAPPERPATQSDGPAVEEVPQLAVVRANQQLVLFKPDIPVTQTFSQMVRACQQRGQGNSMEPVQERGFYFCRFPDMASYRHCADEIFYCSK